MTTWIEIAIKQTEIPQRGLVIVTTRSSDPHSLRPYALSIRDEARGTAATVADFTCEATALHAHAQLARRLAAAPRLGSIADRKRRGTVVWFGDVPALDDDLFDGIGLFGFDAEKQAFVAVTIPAILQWPCQEVRSSDQDGTWPGTQYWAKAAFWNQFPRTRLSLDDVIRLRLDPGFVAVRHGEYLITPARQIEIVRKYAADRDYGEQFAARVMRVLGECEAV